LKAENGLHCHGARISRRRKGCLLDYGKVGRINKKAVTASLIVCFYLADGQPLVLLLVIGETEQLSGLCSPKWSE
jgi:hypothetical protein